MQSNYNDNHTHVENVENGITIHNHNGVTRIPRYGVVANVVKLIADGADEASDSERLQDDYDIDLKVQHNDLRKHRILIDTYYEYASIIERAFSAVDSEKLGNKNKILKTIREFYIASLYQRGWQKGHDRMKLIRANADFIVDDVVEDTKSLVDECAGLKDCLYEDFLIAVKCVVAYAIIECQVLEKP